MKKRRNFMLVVITMLLCFSLTACGSSSDSASFESVTDGYDKGAGTNGSDLYYEESEIMDGEWEDGSSKGNESVSSNRKLIKTVDLTAETYEFDLLVATLESRVTSLGGYMENASVHTRYDDLKYGDFVIRIPVNKLDQFVTEFAEMSNITDRDTAQKDVTLSYVDLESHKEALEAEEKSLLNLLENAASIEDIIALQSRLTDVRYQIESMESQLRTMDNLIDYATINLYIDEVETYTPVVEPSMGERISTGFMESLEDVADGFKNFFIFVIINSPFLVVWGIIIAVLVIVTRLIIKKAIKKMEANEEKRLLEQRQRMQQSQGNKVTNEQNGQENGKQ